MYIFYLRIFWFWKFLKKCDWTVVGFGEIGMENFKAGFYYDVGHDKNCNYHQRTLTIRTFKCSNILACWLVVSLISQLLRTYRRHSGVKKVISGSVTAPAPAIQPNGRDGSGAGATKNLAQSAISPSCLLFVGKIGRFRNILSYFSIFLAWFVSL